MEIDTRNILVDDLAKKKAELLCYGRIEIPTEIIPELYIEKAKIGPSSREMMTGFEFEGRRVKLKISKNSEIFKLRQDEDRIIIKKGDEEFLEVKPLDISTHAPNQIFISLENRCIYNCLFCKKSNLFIDRGKIINLVKRKLSSGEIKAVSITSGVYPSVEKQIAMISNFAKDLKKDYPDIYIGVEPLVKAEKDIDELRKSEIDEIKINIQLPRKDLFNKICGYMNYEKIFVLLEHAVDLFGKGKVTSNLIFGVGENNKDVENCLEKLTDLGVIPNLRLIRLDRESKKNLEYKLGYKIRKTEPRRLLNLAILHKRILEKKSLSTKTFKTMCFPCGCCDIVPFQDI